MTLEQVIKRVEQLQITVEKLKIELALLKTSKLPYPPIKPHYDIK